MAYFYQCRYRTVMTTFRKAYEKRNAPYGLMFHSDRGTQYTSFTFRQFLDSLNVVQSFSKKGYPFDNACCESFFKYLKKEETNRKNYHSMQELYLSVFEYIEDIIIQKDHTFHLVCICQMRWKLYTGSKTLSFLLYFFYIFVSTFLTIVQAIYSNLHV